MSAEIWRSEVLLYGFMILNVLGVAVALAWAWRRGLLGAPDDLATRLEPGGIPTQENSDG